MSETRRLLEPSNITLALEMYVHFVDPAVCTESASCLTALVYRFYRIHFALGVRVAGMLDFILDLVDTATLI